MKRHLLFLVSGIWLLVTPAFAIIDENNNGLSDLWEKAYNNDQLFPNTFDPQADDDQDGWTNAEEAAAGTDPADPNPPDGLVRPDTAHIPAVFGPPDVNGIPEIITPETIALTWSTIPGKQYTLLVSTDLTPEGWLPCGQDATFSGNGNDVTYGFPMSISARSFWRIAVTDMDSDEDGLTDAEENQLGTSPISTDSDNDGLSDAQEIALGTDPNKSDTDEDGLSDSDENQTGTDPKDPDSDDDGMIDGTDADPDEPLVSWAKAPEAGYILIDVEGATNAVLPAGFAVRDLNDKGEVLFNDGIWSQGIFTAKAFPEMITRSVPGPDGNEALNYDVRFEAYERFNSDGKIIGWSETTFTTTPAAGGDPLTSSWTWDGTSEPVHLADTVIANHDAVTGFYPMGIDHRGWAFSSESYYGANNEARRRIVVATGQIPGGSAAGEQYLEPPNGNLVSGMDGHFDVSRSGWLVTNTESQVDPENPNAAKTYQLVMWNPSLEEVTLPAGTDGLHFPVHLNELPNNKPALTATKSGDGGGSVYLQNQAGAMKRCASLSSQRIELFAGDGTAMTGDNKLWRNGKLIPLRELCSKVGELLDAGWNLHALKANKHGTYLIQAEAPDGEMTAKLLVPVEIQRDEDVADGNWQTMEGQLVKALPGQKINLRIHPNKLPIGVVISDIEWVLPDKVFKDYEADQTHATLTQIQDDDRKNTELHFYFADSGRKQIIVNCKVNGEKADISTVINVDKPTTLFSASIGGTAFNAGPSMMGLYAIGETRRGIAFTGNVTVPPGWPQGKWNWVQVVTPGRTKVNTSGNTVTWSLNGQQVLDTIYPFKPSGITNYYATNSKHTDYDTPTAGLIGYTSVTVDDNFEMFIMFLPDGQASRYVPTKSVKWLWGGSAKLSDGAWSLTSPKQTAFPEAENTNHPTWTENVYNGKY